MRDAEREARVYRRTVLALLAVEAAAAVRAVQFYRRGAGRPRSWRRA